MKEKMSHSPSTPLSWLSCIFTHNCNDEIRTETYLPPALPTSHHQTAAQVCTQGALTSQPQLTVLLQLLLASH